MIYTYTTAVNSQLCTDTVGSLSHNEKIASFGLTYIFPEYTVPCNGTAIAWEFCYQRSDASSVMLYPSIWKVTETDDQHASYELIQFNTVTYDQFFQTSDSIYSCQRVDLAATDQFIAPAGSVLGLYSIEAQLLRTINDTSITAYNIFGNQSSVTTSSGTVINYNVSIRVHLRKYDIYVYVST